MAEMPKCGRQDDRQIKDMDKLLGMDKIERQCSEDLKTTSLQHEQHASAGPFSKRGPGRPPNYLRDGPPAKKQTMDLLGKKVAPGRQPVEPLPPRASSPLATPTSFSTSLADKSEDEDFDDPSASDVPALSRTNKLSLENSICVQQGEHVTAMISDMMDPKLESPFWKKVRLEGYPGKSYEQFTAMLWKFGKTSPEDRVFGDEDILNHSLDIMEREVECCGNLSDGVQNLKVDLHTKNQHYKAKISSKQRSSSSFKPYQVQDSSKRRKNAEMGHRSKFKHPDSALQTPKLTNLVASCTQQKEMLLAALMKLKAEKEKKEESFTMQDCEMFLAASSVQNQSGVGQPVHVPQLQAGVGLTVPVPQLQAVVDLADNSTAPMDTSDETAGGTTGNMPNFDAIC